MADFALPTLTRAIGAAVFAAVVAVAVWAVETAAVAPQVAPAAVPLAVPSTVNDGGTLTLEATYDVAAWTISVNGVVVQGAGDARHWRGTVPAGARELTVEATPADVLAGGPSALRAVVTCGNTPRIFTAWGDGAAALRVSL